MNDPRSPETNQAQLGNGTAIQSCLIFWRSVTALFILSVTGCSSSSAIALPANDDVVSIEIQLITGEVLRAPAIDSQPSTREPACIIVKNDERIAALLDSVRTATPITPHKCATVADFEIITMDGDRLRWALLAGHGGGLYDISTSEGCHRFEAKAFDTALRSAGAVDVADRLLPPKAP